MTRVTNLKRSFDKYKTILSNPTLLVELQTSTLKLLAYNYVIVLLIANQDIGWTYKFGDTELANRFGHELIEPKILTKFGFFFRLLTVILNTLTVLTLLDSRRQMRKYLLPCILWNFYTITAIAENLVEIVWTILQLDVELNVLVTIFMVGIFMLAFQSKLTLQVLRFYEYLNYVQ